MGQFEFGFPSIANLSHEGIYPRGPSLLPGPPPHRRDMGSAQRRFETRPRASGFLHADAIWKEAIDQVDKARIAPPLPIDIDGSVATFARGSVNSAFRLGGDQADKLRACDDLEHNEVNLYCTVWTPMKIPTWRHIAQVRRDARPSKKACEFCKGDR